MSLDRLPLGAKAIIKDLSGIDALIRRRLIDMGITEGCVVCLKRLMPFGGPCMIDAFGQSISIRRNVAARIKVQP
jgi:ferrous iron transport protein A